MGAEVAVRSGAGTVVIDARRGDGPPGSIHYTMPALITSDSVIARDPDAVAAAVRALVKTQQALKADISLATKVGCALFPAAEAELIADIVSRDLPFYDPAISPEFVKGMTAFQRHMGLLKGDVAYEDVVATQFSRYWKS
jgi:ABC-type nitrate/sulfonate/bicarbonate transport system substrate-binding protein